MVGQVGGATRAVVVRDDYAYAGIGLRLVVLDVSNPITPTELGATVPFPHFVEGVVISGTSAYVAAGGAGLRVVDISDPAHPSEVGAWDSLGYASDVAIAGDTVYLADGPYGLRLIDVSNPAQPAEVGSVYDMNLVFDVAIGDGSAYIAAAGAGLLVADISDPANPMEVGSLDTPGYAYGVDVITNTAYVADGWEGLQVVNVSDPAHPTPAGLYKTPGWALGVVISDDLAYVADAFMGLQVVDVSNPTHPKGVGGEDYSEGLALDVAVAGSIAYVTDYYGGLRVLDIANPADPTLAGSFVPLGYADGVTVAGDYAYVSAGGSGLQVVDISDPAHAAQLGVYDTQSYATSVAVDGNYAYAVGLIDTSFGEMLGPHVVDISDPTNPIRVGYTDPVGAPRDITVASGIAYIADEWGLETIDVSDPFHPSIMGFVETWEGFDNPPDVTIGIAVSGTVAYMAATADQLEIVDVSDPYSPTLIVTYGKGPPDCLDIAIVGSRAYLACGREFHVVDVSAPTNPAGMGSCDTPTELSGVVVSDTIAYVAAGDGGVAAVDVSDPYGPTLVGAFNTPGLARQVDVAGNYVYVADGINGLLILELVDGGQAGSSGAWYSGNWEVVSQPAVARSWNTPSQWSRQRPEPPDREEVPRAPVSAETSKRIAPTVAERPRITGSCVVTSTADSGAGTLRWCLENAESGTAITFEPTVFPPTSPVTIALESGPLPTILQGNITIDGSDAGVILDGGGLSDGNGLELFSDGNVVRGLQILNFPAHGVSIAYCKDNIVGGDRAQGSGPVGQGNLISGNGGNGVDLSESSTMSNTVIGNLIGTDLSGTEVLANQGKGVNVNLGASHNRIGGIDPRDRNIISGNHIGGINVWNRSHSNLIIGNYVGTDIAGTSALGRGGIGVGGSNNRVEGNLVSGNPDQELSVGSYGGCCNVVIGNLIGTDASGSRAIANGTGGTGISSGGAYNRVGGTTPAERNIVSGKDIGINVSAAGSVGMLVIGNLIGTDITGTGSIGNTWTGVELGYGSRAVVGGATSGERNVISGSGRQGVEVASDYNAILGNYIGTDASGAVAMGNRGAAVRVVVYGGGAEQNVIQGNLIAHTTFSEQESEGVGVLVDSYPHNTIRRNSIHSNAGKGIVTINGGNDMLPAPVITAVTQTGISGTACPGCMVEIFSDQEDEGQIYEGSAMADGEGNWSWTGSPTGPYVTATATDEAGNTSAFSAPQGVWPQVQAAFTASPTSGFAPLTVVFTNTSTGGYVVSSWDFGDSVTSTRASPTHTYSLADVYTVTLTINGPGGTDTLTRTNYIAVREPVRAGFAGSPRYGVPPLTVQFTDTSSGPVATWEWAFGDGESSALRHPTHTYTATGMYTAGLTVRAAGGSAAWPGGTDTLVRVGYVTVGYRIYLPLTLRNR
jgi:PKD repeat protein